MNQRAVLSTLSMMVGILLSLLFVTVGAFGQENGRNKSIRVIGPNYEQVNQHNHSHGLPNSNQENPPLFQFRDINGDGICDQIANFMDRGRRVGFFGQIRGATIFPGNGQGQFPGKGPHEGNFGQGPEQGHHGGNFSPGNGNHYGEEMRERGYGYRFYPFLEEGQVHLTGEITAVDGDIFTIINGAFIVDASDAVIQYVPWFAPVNPDEIVLEAGQRVSLVGQFVETEAGMVLEAVVIRIMDELHSILDPDEGGISGIVDSIDLDNGELIIDGIPILFDDETVIRSMFDFELEAGAGYFATVHIQLIDTDGDELIDALYAKRIVLRTPYQEAMTP